MSPGTLGCDTLSRHGPLRRPSELASPGQWVVPVTLNVAQDNGWSSLGVNPENIGTFSYYNCCVVFVWKLIQKYFRRRPRQRVANTTRYPGL